MTSWRHANHHTRYLTHQTAGTYPRWVHCGRFELLLVKIRSTQRCLCEFESSFHPSHVFGPKMTSWRVADCHTSYHTRYHAHRTTLHRYRINLLRALLRGDWANPAGISMFRTVPPSTTTDFQRKHDLWGSNPQRPNSRLVLIA
jgi:hypothetical protein